MAETRNLASYKRIILCSDGTWLSSDIGDASVPSNVAKIARAIAPTGLDKDGNIVKQVVYYHTGLATGNLPIQQAIYGGLGWGLGNDVCQIYDFVANNYEDGDELFFFGFSRGAFTVRSVAGLVSDVGVLPAVHMSHFAEMWKNYRANTYGESFKTSAWYLDHQDTLALKETSIKVIGVWETVGALGIPQWPVVSWLSSYGVPINKSFGFHNTRLSSNVDYAFQALGLDEKRTTFPPTLWHKTADSPAKNLEQCWFPGVHSNVGGQAEMNRLLGDHEEIDDNSLAWMVDNVAGMLTFEYEAIDKLVKDHKHAINATHIPNGWGCGHIVDNFSGLVGRFFRLLGQMDRTPGDYWQDPIDHAVGWTNETFHPIVRIRKRKVLTWCPPSMKGFVAVEPSHEQPWRWEKPSVQPVPEFVIPLGKKMSVAFKKGSEVPYGEVESLARMLCPKPIMRELDSANGLGAGRTGKGGLTNGTTNGTTNGVSHKS